MIELLTFMHKMFRKFPARKFFVVFDPAGPGEGPGFEMLSSRDCGCVFVSHFQNFQKIPSMGIFRVGKKGSAYNSFELKTVV